jgi:hypothetical protein
MNYPRKVHAVCQAIETLFKFFQYIDKKRLDSKRYIADPFPVRQNLQNPTDSLRFPTDFGTFPSHSL